MKSKLIIWALILGSPFINAQNKTSETHKMEWFGDAKFGVFIHWGIYSVNGISESWAFFNNYISHDNYMKQLQGFTAKNYQPKDWVSLIQNSGAQYAVITSRHHDGVSLWDSEAENAITTTKNAAAKKDVLSPFVTALKKTGLKTGIYYSLPDWSHPNYDIETRTKKRYEVNNQPNRWNKFVGYYQKQLSEISTAYHPDLIWFDGDWEHNAQEWKSEETLALLKSYNPNIIINSRLNHFGDYATPEQGVPVLSPPSKYWELCYTMNDSWGYQPYDNHYKTPNMLVKTLADVVSMGGNLLLDIGPKEDGTILPQQVEILENMGRWTKKYAKGIYGTERGIGGDYFMGKSALSKNAQKLYLFLEEKKSKVRLHGIKTPILSVKTADDSQQNIPFSQDKNGDITLNIATLKMDKDATVVEILFNEKIKLEDKINSNKNTLSSILKSENTENGIYNLAKQVNLGENLLKNSGLTPDGDVFKMKKNENENKEIWEWISKNAEVMCDAQKGLPNGHYPGMSALSTDQQTLYLFVEGQPTGPIAIKGLKNNIARIRVVGEGTMLSHEIFNKLYWSPIPGIVYIDIPKDRLDKNMTVIAILLDKPIELYREQNGAVESNL